MINTFVHHNGIAIAGNVRFGVALDRPRHHPHPHRRVSLPTHVHATATTEVRNRDELNIALQPSTNSLTYPLQNQQQTLHNATKTTTTTPTFPSPTFSTIAEHLQSAPDASSRSRMILEYAKAVDATNLPPTLRTDAHRVMGCTAQVWLTATLDPQNGLTFYVDSDAALSKGLGAILARGLSGLSPEQVVAVDPRCLLALGLGDAVLTRSRTNGFFNMLESAKKIARGYLGQIPRFPTLVIGRHDTTASGAFAEAQNAFLRPDPSTVDALASVLEQKKIGVVAHFYMDPEVQGVLSSAAARWPHIKISDSLVMADGAVKMAEEGCTTIVVLGVDFMSENVRAILDEAGYGHVAVYRMASDPIGCSLAEAAESPAYSKYLEQAGQTPNSLHVVYINTSLRTKAEADAVVPTITCTSSNVVQTVLQAFAQVPDAHVWYGPDTYMGRNLVQLFTSLASTATASVEDVQALHPDHTPDTIAALLPRLHYFDEGTCIVHHLFGGEVCRAVRDGYSDAYIAAHFEVPGEMFSLAMEAKRVRGMGVVGSTQNILDFISARLGEALDRPFSDRLTFVLGTEAGMITSIVRKVQGMLEAAQRDDVKVEIVFPVSVDAITTTAQEAAPALPGGMSVIPGPASGEGCSLEGGCASCPYMKMNSLDALMRVCGWVGTGAGVGPGAGALEGFKPRPYVEKVGGKTMAQAGCVPILHMRGFQMGKRLPDGLVEDVVTRNAVGGV